MFEKRRIAKVLAEFIGVYVLGSVILALLERSSFPFFAAAAASVTLSALVLILGPISGAHLNPAVTLGLLSLRKISVPMSVFYVTAQMAGGYAALRVNGYLLDTNLQGLADTSWDWRIVIAEVLGAMIFAAGVAAALYRSYDFPIKALAIGASLFMGMLVASLGSAGMINPAVAIATSNVSISYLVAPLIGAIAGINSFKYLSVNPAGKMQKK